MIAFRRSFGRKHDADLSLTLFRGSARQKLLPSCDDVLSVAGKEKVHILSRFRCSCQLFLKVKKKVSRVLMIAGFWFTARKNDHTASGVIKLATEMFKTPRKDEMFKNMSL